MLEESKILAVKEEVDKFLYSMQEVNITTVPEYTNAGDILKQVQMRIKQLEDKRKEYTIPLDESKKRIMTDFKAISEPLEKFVENVKNKMLEFHKAEQARKDEEQKKIEVEALKNADGKSVIVVPILNEEVKTQRGDFSTQTVIKRWTYEIVDETKVPREYLCVDEKKIAQAVRDEVRTIEGVKIFQTEELRIR